MIRRLVVISTALGHDVVPHAGGRYLAELDRVARSLMSVSYIVPGTRTNRQAALLPGAPQHVIALGLEPERRLQWKALNRLALVLDGKWRRLDPGMPYLPLLVGLVRSPQAREEMRRADVIDLQWSDSVRLVWVVRRLNPDARVVGTFHDVLSQRFTRELADDRLQRLRWRVIAWESRRHERRMVRALDEVVVFSEKDSELLGSPPHVRVIRPPLADGHARQHVPAQPGRGTVLIVSYLAREENNKAALWVLREVWPLVVAKVPDARLRLVGGGASEELRDLVGRVTSVRLTGFVDDLDAEYASAAVCLVPVLQGAGVKFKTIEALLHGVPTVTTSVGAEGVAGPKAFVAHTDTREGLAAGLIKTLTDPSSAQAGADKTQEWASHEFSVDTFRRSVQGSWGM